MLKLLLPLEHLTSKKDNGFKVKWLERGDRWAFVEEQEADGGTDKSRFPDPSCGRQRKSINDRPATPNRKGSPPGSAISED